VDATDDLIERLAEQQVTLEEIRERSGVSQGSLTHHFGSRDGLVAAAHVARYARTCAADAAFLGRYAGSLSTQEQFTRTIFAHIGELLSDERRAVRWMRMSAIAAALGDEELTAALSDAYTTLADSLTAYTEEARRSGLLQEDADPRTIALLLSMHGQGLVLDDLVDNDVPPEAWNHLMVRFVACFLTPSAASALEGQETDNFGDLWRAEIFGGPGRVPREVGDRLGILRGSTPDLASATDGMCDVLQVRALLERAERSDGSSTSVRPVAASNELREGLIDAGVVALRAAGETGVDVNVLRREAGVSPQSFHRMFGSRDVFLRELRVRLEVSRSARSVARFAGLVATASDATEMQRLLERDAIFMQEEASRVAMWQRIETLAATRTDPELRGPLARVQRATRDLLIEQVCLAQTRGLVDADQPARAIARLLDGTVFWHIFYGLDANRPPREVWIAMLRRIAAFVSPDRDPDRSPDR
jgi:AcrR family transcriptional regulator